jgi:hypothetical protein
MSRKTRRAPKVRQISPTPLVTPGDVVHMEAAIVRPDRGVTENPAKQYVAWNAPGAVARFVGCAYRAIGEITTGLNVLMQNVDAVDRSGQLRRDPMGDGFDFAALRDLCRAASSIVGGHLPDQFYDDYVNAEEELARREVAAAAKVATPVPTTYRMPFMGELGTPTKSAPPPKTVFGIPVVGEIDSADLLRMSRGEVVNTPGTRAMPGR